MRAQVYHPDLGSGARDPGLALAEAVSLTEALPGLDLAGAEVVPVPKPRPGTLFGPGKVAEIKDHCSDHDIGLVIIDGPLTPVQQRNLERAWKVKILDRTGLILEIFGERAQTREGVLQVDLAHLSYQRTRLVRSWTHLERQRGGLGFVGGPGETQIEADRRALSERIQSIRRQLAKVVKTRALHRKSRKKAPFPVVALVGYTNAGKSTLFNRMTGADALSADMLFATLDPTMRKIALPGQGGAILSDTVGFVSDLPTQLVAAFRATLEEVLDADLILHVRDVAHPETDAQAAEVYRILQELGLGADRKAGIIEVLNKVDLLPPDEAAALRNRAAREGQMVISAVRGDGVAALTDRIATDLRPAVEDATLCLDFAQGRARAWLFDQQVVQDERQTEKGYEISVRWTAEQRERFNSAASVE
ncbi:MAG: GTPase HflX [Pseudomonadota bacterium]